MLVLVHEPTLRFSWMIFITSLAVLPAILEISSNCLSPPLSSCATFYVFPLHSYRNHISTECLKKWELMGHLAQTLRVLIGEKIGKLIVKVSERVRINTKAIDSRQNHHHPIWSTQPHTHTLTRSHARQQPTTARQSSKSSKMFRPYWIRYCSVKWLSQQPKKNSNRHCSCTDCQICTPRTICGYLSIFPSVLKAPESIGSCC